MKNIILIGVLIIALLVGFGTVIFYNVQDYEYSLELKESIPTSEVYVTLSQSYPVMQNFGGLQAVGNGSLSNMSEQNIQYVSTILGKMTFENKGVLSRVVEIPRLIACADLTATSTNLGFGGNNWVLALWPTYTIYEPIFNNSLDGLNQPVPQRYYEPSIGITNEIYPQNYYGYGSSWYGYNQQPIEVKSGEKLSYYISLKDSYLSIRGTKSSVLKNTKIEIYEIPTKEFNPISPEITYDSLIYNPTCEMLAREFEPVKTIEII
ncbi:hypothetical protein J4423_04530 [Candidatus Pacearchaeota archaeon]|nr:hypothetical protein [Candidatus Pacearchaeota archaeon]